MKFSTALVIISASYDMRDWEQAQLDVQQIIESIVPAEAPARST